MYKFTTIRSKLILTFTISLLFLIATNSYNLFSLRESNHVIKTIHDDRVVALKQLKMISDMYAVNIVDNAHKISNQNVSWLDGQKNIEKAISVITSEKNAYLSTHLTPEEKKLADEMVKLMDRANDSVFKLKQYVVEKNLAALKDYTVNEMYHDIDPLTEKINEITLLQLRIVEDEFLLSQERYSNSIKINLLVILLSLSITAYFSLTIISYIRKKLLI